MNQKRFFCNFLYSFLLFWRLTFNNVVGIPESQVTPQVYDFIVVGGGTAGCAVASRLSEDGQYSVLIVESGGYPESFLEIPANFHANLENPEVTFQYQSVPQKNAMLLNNGTVRVRVGKVLGGTSQINANIFNRGSPLDFDNWAKITGDSSWDYSNLLKYFKKSESYLGEFPSALHHGFIGPIAVSYQPFAPGREVWKEAGMELGFPYRDPNGPQEVSFTPMEFSRRFGRRHSSFRGYIEPIIGTRTNMKIITYANVTQVLFDEEGKAAVGVKYVLKGTDFESVAFANHEIILSAGTFGSSILLMKSGVGPRDVLESAGVKQIKELPVGENLQEHPIIPMHIILNNKSLSSDLVAERTPEAFELWRLYGIGPFSTIVANHAQTFQVSSVAKREGQVNWPDIHTGLASNTAILEPFRGNYIAPWETSVRIHMHVGRPRSRGTVKLDRNGEPLIDFNYFGDIRDEDIVLDAINSTLKIFEGTRAYQRYGARLFNEPLPACAHFPFRSELYWRCYMKQVTVIGNHAVGTCAMNTVVDSKLRVKGISGLRVVDASIMPFITNTNTHAAVYAIAEKASQDILRDYVGDVYAANKFYFNI